MLPVLCYGDICADLLIPYGKALSALNEAVDPDALTVRFSHGGSVANTAVTLARLGAPALFLGTAGQDAFGRTLKSGLEKEGVDASLLALKETSMTTMVLLVLDAQGERVPFAYPRFKASQHDITSDQIPEDIKKSRYDIIYKTQQEISLKSNQDRVGTEVYVTIDSVSDDGIFYVGRSYGEAPEIDPIVYVASSREEELVIGNRYKVKILEASEYDMTGVTV